eukprot:CAMPEP_0198275996 /NCGR_PEP_ID=MMETSP1447-20131203/65074_1 /TAXON_ID=420782 /ORGANISM="Chaetoceros dichaeta, Strain CCMP1751" /LENGTH=143 /DNA_ID=CAMNT_0043970911 /DNA_START=1766 /DNA_END=2196 /DNA_ORIENTATION=+
MKYLKPTTSLDEVDRSGSTASDSKGSEVLQSVSNDAPPKGGLLTHWNLDDSPTFGITTRGGNEYNDLDWSDTVFGGGGGCELKSLLDMVAELSMYCNDQLSLQTITGDNGGNGDCTSGFSVGGDGSDTYTAIMVVEEAASAVF